MGVAKFTTIVVGVDGQDGGWEALALAQRLAGPDGAILVVVCAYPELAVQHAGLVWPRIRLPADAGEVLDGAGAHLCGDQRAEYVCAAGSTPGSVLQSIAVERSADVIVIGSSRRAVLGRVLGGDVVHQTLDHAPCPVAVAPHGLLDCAAPLLDVGVAVDGTPESLAAVRWAGELTLEPFAIRTLELIHVDARADQGALGAHTPFGHLDDKYRLEVFAALRLVGRLGSSVEVTWTDAAGAVGSALANLTSALDLLVLGTHGRGPLGHLLHGGVARDVADSARCPVVAVPHVQSAVTAGASTA
jgi:nucleotide-binding universal stress UspA family protein